MIKPDINLTILFGTYTGNSELLAMKMVGLARSLGIEATVENMADFNMADLSNIKNLAIIVSTQGIGEPPISSVKLYSFLHSDQIPTLSEIRYSVLALGDTEFEHFCQTGKDFDFILEEKGAFRLFPRMDCDVDYKLNASIWMNGFLEKLTCVSRLG